MIWHIFKKDWKLLWKFAAMLAAVQFVTMAVVIKLSPFVTSASLRDLLQLLVMALIVGIPFLIAAVVHQDAIPGVRQDWLVRPIRRKDLLLAKLLFVVLAVHAPMLLTDLWHGLAFGFPFGASLAAALSRGLFVLFALTLPLLAFASLTKNSMEAIAGGLIMFLAFAAAMLFLNQTARQSFLGETGLAWIFEAAACLVGVAAAAAVLGLQYFRRRTLVARGLAAGALSLAVLTMFFPWNPAFAVQQRMSPNPGAASAVAVSFDPAIGRFHRFTADEAFHGNEEWALVYLPLRFENLPAGSALNADHAEVRRLAADGSSSSVGTGEDLSLRQETSAERPAAHLTLLIPGALYQQIQDQPSQFNIDLSLTLLRSAGPRSIPALNGSVHFPDLGTCVTKVNAAETAVRLGCVPLKESPTCFRLYLQHVPSGRMNFPQFQCRPDYTPFYDEVFVVPPPTRNVPFRDLSGLAKFPVDGSQLGESQIVIETYQPMDHFTRTITIPSLRLKDWTAEQ